MIKINKIYEKHEKIGRRFFWNKKVLNIIFVMFTAVFAICVPSSKVTADGTWAYNKITDGNGDYAVITGYKGDTSLTSIIIPGIIDGIPVKGISNNYYESPFGKCGSLTSVTIPSGVTSIGSDAFYGCSKLSSITIPDSVTSIGDCAFENCSSLSSVTIPNSVTSIGQWAFGYCKSLSSVTIPSSVTSIGEHAFSGCDKLSSVTIQNGVTSMGSWTFSNCSGLTSITIPNSVTGIGSDVFEGCSSLSNITIPDSVTSIGSNAFYGCGSLVSAYFEGDAPTLEYGAFDNTSSGFTIYYNANAAGFTNPWNGYGTKIYNKLTVKTDNSDYGTVSVTDGKALGSDTYTAEYGKTVIGAAAKEGYNFTGWYDSKGNLISRSAVYIVKESDASTYIAKFQVMPTLTVNVQGTGNVADSSGSWTSGNSKSYFLGTEVTLTASDSTDSPFMYWVDSYNQVLATDKKYTFYIASDTTINAVFGVKKSDDHLVTFKNGITGETIQSEYVNNSDTAVSKPSDPYMYGYTFKGWDKNDSDIISSNSDLVVTAQFEKQPQKYTVTVDGGTINGTSTSGEYAIKDYITITANVPQTGKKFSYWQDSAGNIVCYAAAYKFNVISDVTLKAVYVDDTEAVEQKANIIINKGNIDSTNRKITFIANRVIPDGCQVISHGIILTKDASVGNSAANFIIGEANVLKGTAKINSSIGTYVLTKANVQSNETWYARGYVVYKDSNGNIITLYSSNIASGNI